MQCDEARLASASASASASRVSPAGREEAAETKWTILIVKTRLGEWVPRIQSRLNLGLMGH